MIPLMKNPFHREAATRQALAQFVMSSDRLSMGQKCEGFEAVFAQYQGCKMAVLFNSGGSANLALLQALKNLGLLQDGDLIGFSALTWSTNVMPILQLNMTPVPVDISRYTLNSMSIHLRERLDEAPLRAFFTTNALGFAGDLENIQTVTRERDILLLEDNCESLGTELPAGKAGNFGFASTFSFYVAHHMSTIEGGMVCTDDPALAEMLRIVRANGWDRNLTAGQQQEWRTRHDIQGEFQAKYTFYDLGYNLRPTEITGFLGLSQLPFVAESNRRREQIYLALEEHVRENPDLVLLDHSHIKLLSNFAFPVICRSEELRDQYLKRFEQADIEVRPVIAGNMQMQPFFRKYVITSFSLPEADFIHHCGFYCGNYPELTDEDLLVIASCLKKAV